jgi:hypothetical protein
MENALETLVAARARGVQILKHGGKIDQAAPRQLALEQQGEWLCHGPP